MKIYNSLKEMRDDNVPEQVLQQVTVLCENAEEDSAFSHLDRKPSDDFDWNFGGHIHIVETVDDLKKIAVTAVPSMLPRDQQDPDAGGWSTPLEGAWATDQAFYLPGREWAVIWTAWNDTGGPTYFIPKEVIQQTPNNTIEGIIILTNQGELKVDQWKRNQPNGDGTTPF